jgi:hypothetical protein
MTDRSGIRVTDSAQARAKGPGHVRRTVRRSRDVVVAFPFAVEYADQYQSDFWGGIGSGGFHRQQGKRRGRRLVRGLRRQRLLLWNNVVFYDPRRTRNTCYSTSRR